MDQRSAQPSGAWWFKRSRAGRWSTTLVLVAACAAPAAVVVPVASHHYGEDIELDDLGEPVYGQAQLNESNPGLGLQWGRRAARAELGVYLNSYRDWSPYLGLELVLVNLAGRLELGLAVGAAWYEVQDAVLPIGGPCAALRLYEDKWIRAHLAPPTDDTDAVLLFSLRFGLERPL